MLLFPILSLLLLLCSHVVGLKFRLTASVRQTALSIANIETFAKNMVLTEPLKERIERKIGKVINKLGSDALWSHVVLKVLNSPPLGEDVSTVPRFLSTQIFKHPALYYV